MGLVIFKCTRAFARRHRGPASIARQSVCTASISLRFAAAFPEGWPDEITGSTVSEVADRRRRNRAGLMQTN